MEIKIIKSEKQYKTYLNRMKEIFNSEKGTPEYEELDLLALVLERYEEETFPIKEEFTNLNFTKTDKKNILVILNKAYKFELHGTLLKKQLPSLIKKVENI